MIGARENSLSERMSASTVGVLAARVAAIAGRRADRKQLEPADKKTLGDVARFLQHESAVLRGVELPNVEDETAYAFASASLRALGAVSGATARENAEAARALEELAEELGSVATGETDDSAKLLRLQTLFLWISSAVADGLGQTGEKALLLSA